MERRRVYGLGCLILLCVLCVQSLFVAPAKWDAMPAIEQIGKDPGRFEGKEVVVDGLAGDVSRDGAAASFSLSPVHPVFGSVLVHAEKGSEVKKGAGVNVTGTVRDGEVFAKEVRVSSMPLFLGVVFNAAGIAAFILFGLEDFRIKKSFPFLEAR